MPKKVTTEDLAKMIKRGFDETANKAELGAFRADVGKQFEGVDKQFEVVNKRLSRLEMEASHTNARLSVIERDTSEIRKHFVYRDEFEDALARILLLEKKVGIKSGK